jgi:hypothetical protein
LHIKLDEGFGIPTFGGLEMDFDDTMAFLQVSIMNTGTVPSYISAISFKAIVDGKQKYFYMLNLGDPILDRINPKFGTPLEAGRKQVFNYPFEVLQRIKKQGKEVYPFEVVVTDEIGNQYSTIIPVELINKIFG